MTIAVGLFFMAIGWVCFIAEFFFQPERYSLVRAVGAVFEKKNKDTKQFIWIKYIVTM
jgi:hypothetical protein